MNRTTVLMVLLSSALTGRTWAADETLRVAQMFIPPGAQMADLIEADRKTGKTVNSLPAVLSAHIVSPKSNDLAFVYSTKATDVPVKLLFFAVAHQTKSGYVKVFETTFYGQLLWVQDFHTVGLQLKRLPGNRTDSVVVIAGVGASLGATMRVFHWNALSGMVNVFPESATARRFQFIEGNNSFRVMLSSERYQGDENARPAVGFEWEGDRFVKMQDAAQAGNCPTCPR